MKHRPYIILYLLIVLSLFSFLLVAVSIGLIQHELLADHKLISQCIFIGGIGAITYCLRAIYLNIIKGVEDYDKWAIWYYLRPIIGLVMGGVSWLFLKAGLLALQNEPSSPLQGPVFMSLAFIAGYNISQFLQKLEDIANSLWGIKKSKSGEQNSNKQ